MKKWLFLITFFVVLTFSLSAQWKVHKYVDEFDDSEYWNVINDQPISYSDGDSQYLVIGFDNNSMWLALHAGLSLYTPESKYSTDIRYRLDKDPAESQTWGYNSSRENVYTDEYVGDGVYVFLRKLLNHNTLLFESIKYNQNKVTIKYSLEGLNVALAEGFGTSVEGIFEQIDFREQYEKDHPVGK